MAVPQEDANTVKIEVDQLAAEVAEASAAGLDTAEMEEGIQGMYQVLGGNDPQKPAPPTPTVGDVIDQIVKARNATRDTQANPDDLENGV